MCSGWWKRADSLPSGDAVGDTEIGVEEPAGQAWQYGDKCGVTGTLKDLKIVVAQKQELGVEKGEEASCWTLDTNVGRNKKKI